MNTYIIIILFFLSNITTNANATSDTQDIHKVNLVAPATLFPNQRIFFKPSQKDEVINRLNEYIVNDLKTDGMRFFIGTPTDTDYYVKIDYAFGCPNLGESTDCRLMALWSVFRGDNAPVTMWRAFYPVQIPIDIQLARFNGFKVSDQMIQLMSDDFIKSYNFEVLKNQEYDQVYVKADHLHDGTSLCTADSMIKYYSDAGLYTTDKSYRARFLIDTKVKMTGQYIPQEQGYQIIVQRLILDRITGQSSIFPFTAIIKKQKIQGEYDCKASANITMQMIGKFIDTAP